MRNINQKEKVKSRGENNSELTPGLEFDEDLFTKKKK